MKALAEQKKIMRAVAARRVARAKGRGSWPELSPVTEAVLKNTGKGRVRDFHEHRQLVRCQACGVTCVDSEEQKQGHLQRAHGGRGSFEEVTRG